MQFTPSTGGAASNGSTTGNSLIADLDYEIMNSDKYIYGDVDIRRNLIATAAMVSVSGRVLGSGGNGLSGIYVYLTDADGTREPRSPMPLVITVSTTCLAARTM